jgi:SAM-dependent methyltransferase
VTGEQCPACGAGDLRTIEEIRASDIAAAWRREDLVVGRKDVAELRTASLLSALPETILFDECQQCGIEIARPRRVWVADEYPSDQSYPVRWEFQRCVDDLGDEPADVLELGCGTGEFMAMAASRGHRVVGADFSAAVVGVARARGLQAFVGSLDDLKPNLPPGTAFDAIVLFHVIEHLTDVEPLFETLSAWARPNARLFIACPGPRRYSRLIREQQAGRSDFWDYPPHHVLRWTLRALDAVTRRHGWTPEISMEEPLHWAGAASHIGVARALYRGALKDPVRRRLTIAGAWASLAAASRNRHSGTSLYVSARKGG